MTAAANTSALALEIPLAAALRGTSAARAVLEAAFAPSAGAATRHLLYFAESKDLALPDPGLRLQVSRQAAGWVVTVSARALAKAVELTAGAPGRFEDNFSGSRAGVHECGRARARGQLAAPAARATAVHSREQRGAQRRLLQLIQDPALSLAVKNRAGSVLTSILEVHGRWQEALTRKAAVNGAEDGPEAAEVWDLVDRMLADFLVFRRPDRAAERVARLRELAGRVADADLHLWIALGCAQQGDPGCARNALERLPHGAVLQPWSAFEVKLVHGAIAVAEGEPQRALGIFRGDDQRCENCLLPFLGRTFVGMQQPDSAAVVFERFVRSTSVDRIWVDGELAPIHEWLAEYYETRGGQAAAARHYARFIELWEGADPELQPRVALARSRLAALQPDR